MKLYTWLIMLPALIMTFGLARHSSADARYVLVTLLHTNDLHGQVMPAGNSGGLARIATLVRQIRSEMPNVLLLDGGDIIHGSYEDYLSQGHASISAMNALGYDVAAAGNHEFDFGLDTVRSAIETASFPFLAANIHAAGGGQWSSLQPYQIFVVDGVRIGVFGLASLETITLHWPDSIKDIVVDDPITAAKTIIPELRKSADVIVLLSHLGYKEDENLASKVSGIDFIIGSHTHTYLDTWRWNGSTLITQAGSSGRALGRIDFIVRVDGSKASIASVNGKGSDWSKLPQPPLGKKYPSGPLMLINNGTPEDTTVQQAYQPFRAAADAKLAEVIGEAPAGLSGRPQAPDFVVDAVRQYAGSDIAIIDAKSVSESGLVIGNVTVRSAFDTIKGFTRQEIPTIQMSGKNLQFALNRELASRGPAGMDISGAVIEYITENDLPKVTSITIAGQPLDPARSYTIAGQSYVLMTLMNSIPGVSIIAEPKGTTREAIVEYIRTHKIVSAPVGDRIVEKTSDQSGENKAQIRPQ